VETTLTLNRDSAAKEAAADDRRPRGLDRNERSLAGLILARERKYQAAAWAMVIVGIAGSFIAPALLATFAVTIQKHLHAPPPLGWFACFTLASAAIVPLLFWVELKSRGQWSEDELAGDGTTVGEALLAPARCTAARPAVLAAVAEILLPAPRMILAARDRWSASVPAAILHDAAAVLNYLRQDGPPAGGVRASDLPTVRPLRVLCYLVSREWVGLSPAGDRVWLLPEARRSLSLEVTLR
jgi:hypothetical protein